MKTLILALLFSTSVFAQGLGSPAAELAKHANVQGTLARIQAFSKGYLGLPYGYNGPLGEGPTDPYDQDPLWRFDTFDCTTFVETMMALALTHTEPEFTQKLQDIRYAHGVISYVTRNHFTDLDWVPNNITNGLMNDITRNLVDAANVHVASALIDLPNHYRVKKMDELRVFDLPPQELPARLEQWRNEGARMTAKMASIDYIAIDWLVNNPQVLDGLPDVSVVNMIRPNWDIRDLIGTRQNVSHQGFVIRHSGKMWMRHATSAGDHIVTEEPFLDYIRRYVGHATLKGVHFMSINE